MEIKAPIFLVGYPRSGTTFLQSLIATQSGIITFPETHFYTVLTGFLDDSERISIDLLPEIIGRASRMLDIVFEQGDIEELESGEDATKVSRGKLFKWLISHLSNKQSKEIEVRDSSTLLEKTPSHAWHMEKILLDFPDARFIYITRHPVDSIASHDSKLSKGSRDLSQLVSDWIRTHDAVFSFKEKNPERLYILSYEKLAENKLGEMKALMEFIGRELEESKLSSYREKASDVILNHEHWKSKNTSTSYSQSSGDSSLNWKKTAEIQFLLHSRMKKEGHPIRSGFKQALYDLKMGVLNEQIHFNYTRISLISL